MTGRTQSPRVTVLMAVHNGEQFLPEALDSVLAQSFDDFELLVVDDGSIDRSAAIVQALRDPRVRLISQPSSGLAAALNLGLEHARGEYIARHDDDDVSLPNRLERQVEYLDRHPDVALIGSNYTIIDEVGTALAATRVFTHPDDVALALVLSNQFGHGSVMMRRSVVMSVGGYDCSADYVEDYDLWTRLSHVAQVANLAEDLYRWRRSDEGISLANQEAQVEQAFRIRDREFCRLFDEPMRFKVFTSWHPRSYRPDVRTYFDRKGTLYRDLAYLCRRDGRWISAAVFLAVATVVGPGRRRQSFRFLLRHVRYRSRAPVWEWEYV